MTQSIKIAVLDLYNNMPNQGMRCIKELLCEHQLPADISIEWKTFDVRYKNEMPGFDYDIYISSGGPGSPHDGEGTEWEKRYFYLLEKIWSHNLKRNVRKKYMFFVCHSFQMACRFFNLAEVTKRRSTAFGIFPVHKTSEGLSEPLFKNLSDPFYTVDSRDWQVIHPSISRLKEMGSSIIALEKIRDHVELDRAVMAIRFSNEMFGTQFHPEADARGMSLHFKNPEKREQVITNYGEQKYAEMIKFLSDPTKIHRTQKNIIPGFIDFAINDFIVKEVFR